MNKDLGSSRILFDATLGIAFSEDVCQFVLAISLCEIATIKETANQRGELSIVTMLPKSAYLAYTQLDFFGYASESMINQYNQINQ